MTQPLIGDVGAFAELPRCQHHDGQQCRQRAPWWVVSPDGRAISTHCERHARAVVDEYEAAGLTGWRLVRVKLYRQPRRLL